MDRRSNPEILGGGAFRTEQASTRPADGSRVTRGAAGRSGQALVLGVEGRHTKPIREPRRGYLHGRAPCKHQSFQRSAGVCGGQRGRRAACRSAARERGPRLREALPGPTNAAGCHGCHNFRAPSSRSRMPDHATMLRENEASFSRGRAEAIRPRNTLRVLSSGVLVEHMRGRRLGSHGGGCLPGCSGSGFHVSPSLNGARSGAGAAGELGVSIRVPG